MKKLFSLTLAGLLSCSMAWSQTVVSDAAALKNAIAAGGSIQLGADIALSSVVTVSKDVVLDLNNKTLTINKAKGLTVQNGSLELTGTGTVSSTYNHPLYVVGSTADIADYSTLKVGSNVKVSTTGNYAIGVFSASNSTSTAYGANLEVNGTLESLCGVDVSSYITATTGNVPVLKFDGATINSQTTGLELDGFAKTTLDNTTITLSATGTSIRTGVNVHAGVLTINGGAMQNTNLTYGIYLNQNTSISTATVVNIKGGTFKATEPLFKMSSKGTFAVSGGLFSKAVSSQFCAAGYQPTTTPDAQGYYTVEAKKTSITAYYGTSTAVATSVTTAEWENILKTTPNAVAIIDNTTDNQTFANSTKNIILKSEIGSTGVYSYSCPNFVLTDLKNWGQKNATTAAATNFYSPVPFTAVTGSYSRPLRGDYNSVCVPFAIAAGTFGSYEILAYTSYDQEDNDAMFNYQDAASAGAAIIIKPAADMEWNVTFNNTEILGSPVQGTAFQGVFVTTDYTGKNAYSVNTSLVNKFSPLANNLYPFRSCFSLTGEVTAKSAPRLVILGAEDATALDEVRAAKAEKVLVNGQILIHKNGQFFDINGKIVK